MPIRVRTARKGSSLARSLSLLLFPSPCHSLHLRNAELLKLYSFNPGCDIILLGALHSAFYASSLRELDDTALRKVTLVQTITTAPVYAEFGLPITRMFESLFGGQRAMVERGGSPSKEKCSKGEAEGNVTERSVKKREESWDGGMKIGKTEGGAVKTKKGVSQASESRENQMSSQVRRIVPLATPTNAHAHSLCSHTDCFAKYDQEGTLASKLFERRGNAVQGPSRPRPSRTRSAAKLISLHITARLKSQIPV
jgi:hypothetical protein